jgi:hypothetical protein
MIRVGAILFEVMDKEWPLWFVLVGFLGVGIGGFFVCKRKPILAILFLVWATYGGFRQVAELNDNYVGPAIRAEGGLPYIVLSYISIASALLLPPIGAWFGRAERKDKSAANPA